MTKLQQRKTLTNSKPTANKIQTGAGQHQLQKKSSASSLAERQTKEARLKAEEEAEKKVKRETEKILEEKKKVRSLLSNMERKTGKGWGIVALMCLDL